MAAATIGKLERVPVREVWEHEALDFTTWLEDNIAILSDSIGLQLAKVERERPAGDFNVDLIAEDIDGDTVVIENQLGKSDHGHLGQLITYLTMMEAKTAIWIVSDPRAEHVSAVTWLNESTNASFYLVKLEAVRIGNSAAAPLFTKIVGPSEETREISYTKKDKTERHILRQKWWKMLIERAARVSKLHAHLKPRSGSYIDVRVSQGVSLKYLVTQYGTSIELYIDHGDGSEAQNKYLFDLILEKKKAIETAFGHPLIWDYVEGRRGCAIRYEMETGGYKSDESQWPSIQDEDIKMMGLFEKAIVPHLREQKEILKVIS